MGTSSETKDELLLIAEQHILDLSNPDDQQPWVALQLFCMNQRQIAEELKDRNFETFVPLEWVVTEKKPGQRVRVLRPVVRNLLFLKAKMPDDLLRKEMSDIKFPVRLLRKSKDSNELAKIPACQMYDFQVMCNPELVGRKIISTEEAKLIEASRIDVTAVYAEGQSAPITLSLADGIVSNALSQADISCSDGSLHISGLFGNTVSVWTISGQLFYTNKVQGSLSLPLPKGVYIVGIDGTNKKVTIQ